MHESSYRIMKQFALKYIKDDSKYKVLDVGSQMIDGQQEIGSYKSIFDKYSNVSYTGCDMVAGLNVDVILESPYNWSNIPENSFDFVISGQMFEHVEYPWHTMIEIARVLKPEGVCCIIAPSAGPMHNYPLDCYRYYPDGLAALAKYAGLEVIDTYAEWDRNKHPYLDTMWHDVVCIARKGKTNDNSDRRDKMYELSCSYMKNEDFTTLNPTLDASLWKDSSLFTCKLYFDIGSGYSEKNILIKECSANGKYISLKFIDLPVGIKAFRFDPCDQPCIISELNVKVNKKEMSVQSSNAFKTVIKSKQYVYLFDTNDPQFYFDFSNSEKINEIEIMFDISMASKNIIECI